MYNLSNICKTANKLIRNGLTKSEAFKRAWALAKSFTTRVAGVSFGKRPEALKRLSHYRAEQISISLIREDNQFDNNAVAVMASVVGKGGYVVGYLPSELSKIIAPLMDSGTKITSAFKKIVGGWFEWQRYGMRIDLSA